MKKSSRDFELVQIDFHHVGVWRLGSRSNIATSVWTIRLIGGTSFFTPEPASLNNVERGSVKGTYDNILSNVIIMA